MRPSGPVPVTAARSIPRSRAMRRASGDAFTRPPSALGEGSISGASGAAGSSATGSGAGFAAAASGSGAVTSTSSPSSPMTAIARPTSISSPSPARIFSRTPEASDSTSCVTFSVSSS